MTNQDNFQGDLQEISSAYFVILLVTVTVTVTVTVPGSVAAELVAARQSQLLLGRVSCCRVSYRRVSYCRVSCCRVLA